MRRSSGLIFSLALLLIFAMPSSNSSEEEIKPVAYVIAAASNAFEKGKQPTWIGLMSGRRTVHIPANKAISEVSPGTYHLHHFDFNKPMTSAFGTLTVNRSRMRKMKLSPSIIYYIGRFEVSKKDNTLVNDPLLIKEACKVYPSLFGRLPLRFLYIGEFDKDYQLDCATQTLTSFDE